MFRALAAIPLVRGRGEQTRPMRTDEWAPLEEMFVLSDAGTVDEFHRRLVLFPPVGRSRADAFEPACLFRHYHGIEERGAATTALLLVSDGRWRNATGRIMETIATSGLIGDEHLDLLAQSFLAAGRCLYWQAPEGWFDDSVEVVLEDRTDSGPPGAVAASAVTDDRPVVVPREIRPPLRRWAAARLVRQDPAIWGSVLKRTGELDARSAAAVMRGLLDAIGSLPEPVQSLLRRRAADWPQRDVRAAAETLQPLAGKPANEPHRSRCTTIFHVTARGAPRHGAPTQQELLF
jgi:hypothetical protein